MNLTTVLAYGEELPLPDSFDESAAGIPASMPAALLLEDMIHELLAG